MRKNFDLTGRRFSMLLVQAREGSKMHPTKNKKSQTTWRCLCDCGNIVVVARSKLLCGKKKYCSRENHKDVFSAAIRRGAIKPRVYSAKLKINQRFKLTYSSWSSMKHRCSPHGKYAKHGTRICDRWQSFAGFLADMGERPTRLHTIERENNLGDYEPGNCIWGTKSEQAENKRSTRWVFWEGDLVKLVELCREKQMPLSVVGCRLTYGWSIERALSEPIGQSVGRPRKKAAFQIPWQST